jgi:hypothetical protein
MRRASPQGLLFTVYGPELNTFSAEDISVRILVGVSSRETRMPVGGMLFLFTEELNIFFENEAAKDRRNNRDTGVCWLRWDLSQHTRHMYDIVTTQYYRTAPSWGLCMICTYTRKIVLK